MTKDIKKKLIIRKTAYIYKFIKIKPEKQKTVAVGYYLCPEGAIFYIYYYY